MIFLIKLYGRTQGNKWSNFTQKNSSAKRIAEILRRKKVSSLLLVLRHNFYTNRSVSWQSNINLIVRDVNKEEKNERHFLSEVESFFKKSVFFFF